MEKIQFNFLNLNRPSDSDENNIDIAIIGGGPSGLTAGIYSARAGFKTIIFEKISLGGQIFVSSDVENYPGFINISGSDLIANIEKQAKNFGVNFIFEEINKIEIQDKDKILYTFSEKIYKAKAVIIATGANYKDLNIPGETKFKGKGVSNCATCDGAFYKNMEVAVVGGGDTAVEEALFLTRFARKVYIIHRRDKLRATFILQKKAFENNKIEFIYNSIVEEIIGDKFVTGVKIKNVKTSETKIINVSGVFIFIGFKPNTSFLKNFISLDENGYIITDNLMRTSKEGIFACGDCINKLLRQVVTACGDGATAAFSAIQYIENIKK